VRNTSSDVAFRSFIIEAISRFSLDKFRFFETPVHKVSKLLVKHHASSLITENLSVGKQSLLLMTKSAICLNNFTDLYHSAKLSLPYEIWILHNCLSYYGLYVPMI